MLRSCRYCGRIHDTKVDCGKKPKRMRCESNTEAAKFRRKEIWKQTSLSIRDRDHNLCQVCLAQYKEALAHREQANNDSLERTPALVIADCISVHHIKSICTHPELALERTNLITLCSQHHEEAENGEINADWLTDLATRAEEKT